MPSVILKETTFERHDKGTALALRYLPPRDPRLRFVPNPDRRVWYKCVPDSALTPAAPANAVVEIVDVVLEGDQPVIRYQRPSGDDLENTAVLWGQSIPSGATAGAEGLCTLEPAFAAWDTLDTTPANDEEWGTEADSYLLHSGHTGYRILGAVDSGIVYVERKPAVVDEKVAVTTGETPGRLSDVIQGWQSSPAYNATRDLTIKAEAVGTTPDKNAQFYIYAPDYTGYASSGTLAIGIINNVAQFIPIPAGVVVTGTTPWIVVTGAYNVAHGGPNSGEATTTLGGASFGAGTADTASLDLTASANAVSIWSVDRIYQGSPGAEAQIFARQHRCDTLGHWNLVSGETEYPTGLTFPTVAVDASQNVQYLESNFSDKAHSGGVLGVDWTKVGTTPSKTLNGEVDLTELTGWSPTGVIVLIADAGVVKWGTAESPLTFADDNTWIDVSRVGNTVTVSHIGPASGETTTTIGDDAMGAGTPDSTSFDFTASANAGRVYGISRLYQSLPGDAVHIFYRLYTADTKGHWNAISGETEDAGTIDFPDEKVAVDASQNTVYLESGLSNLGHSAGVLGIDFTKVGTTPNKTLNARTDLTTISGWVLATQQVLKHNTSGVPIWELENTVDIVGVTPWISVTQDGNEWTIAHAGPNSGQTTTTLGSAAEGGATDGTSFNFTTSTNAGAAFVLSRLTYAEGTTKPPLYMYFREVRFDSLGHANFLSAETQVSTGFVDELAGVSSNDTTPGYLKDKIVGDANWTDIEEVNDAGNEDLKIKHIGPKSGESTTSLGSSGETETADTTSHNVASSGAVSYTKLTRIAYNDAGDETLYAFYRTEVYDSKGHLLSISGETRVSIDAPDPC